MNLTDYTSVINNVGFPIFCVLALGFFIWKAFKIVMTNNKEREIKLYDTITDVREQLKTASETNASFIKVLEAMSEDIDEIKHKIDKE